MCNAADNDYQCFEGSSATKSSFNIFCQKSEFFALPSRISLGEYWRLYLSVVVFPLLHVVANFSECNNFRLFPFELSALLIAHFFSIVHVHHAKITTRKEITDKTEEEKAVVRKEAKLAVMIEK